MSCLLTSSPQTGNVRSIWTVMTRQLGQSISKTAPLLWDAPSLQWSVCKVVKRKQWTSYSCREQIMIWYCCSNCRCFWETGVGLHSLWRPMKEITILQLSSVYGKKVRPIKRPRFPSFWVTATGWCSHKKAILFTDLIYFCNGLKISYCPILLCCEKRCADRLGEVYTTVANISHTTVADLSTLSIYFVTF